MAAVEESWNLELSFWRVDGDSYDRHLTPDAHMLFSEPVGMLDRGAIIHSIADAPRWREVEITYAHALQLHPAVVLLTYQATARREGDAADYRARVISVYRQDGETWKLAFHQQMTQPRA